MQVIATGTKIREMEASISALKAEGKTVEERTMRVVRNDQDILPPTRNLAEVGVPDVERTAALAGFNVGVELGQLTFVLAALLGVSLLSRAGARALRGGLLVTRTAMGALGAFWTLERLGRIV